MASYRGHLTFSSILGVGYGAAALYYWELDVITAALGAGLTAASGMLPDLDSDSGVPVRALFGGAAVIIPLLMLPRLLRAQLPLEQVLLLLASVHFFVRYGASALFKKVTVHRGMFHSVPAMLISGLAVFLLYHHADDLVRYYLAGGVMLGFLSHLVLDELCSVDIVGAKVKLNQFAGTALKFFSPSWGATALTYLILACLAYTAAQEFDGARTQLQQWQQKALNVGSSLGKATTPVRREGFRSAP
ncbi:MAG: metal-dependent hydrolase [Planctomycetia bacterium]|nr:metal-dependent hydrolase [Planctomycetia bacterium]